MSREGALWIGGVRVHSVQTSLVQTPECRQICFASSFEVEVRSGSVGISLVGNFLFQLEPYMDEDFLKNALSMMGEENVISIKVREIPVEAGQIFSDWIILQVIKNKFTGEPASYGFINFDSDPAALMAMHKLNGKIIPNSTPVSLLPSFPLSRVDEHWQTGVTRS